MEWIKEKVEFKHFQVTGDTIGVREGYQSFEGQTALTTGSRISLLPQGEIVVEGNQMLHARKVEEITDLVKAYMNAVLSENPEAEALRQKLREERVMFARVHPKMSPMIDAVFMDRKAA
ncbi:MAG: hypothetical protein ACD_28C00365G0002 [uncultured bacterium]|nr:MAG: hypothetical protein ACD_28C00365G0002 [uncultured bacterium]